MWESVASSLRRRNLADFLASARTLCLELSNWLTSSQRFHVSIERVEGGDDLIHTLSGPKTIDIPGSKIRKFKVSFFGYMQGESKWKVTFTNRETGEYVFYLLTVKVAGVAVLDEYSLRTQVRHPASKIVSIENPLPPDAT